MIGQTGTPIEVVATGPVDWIIIGKTVDWSKVAAVAADTVTPEGFTVRAGNKWLRYGQVLTKIAQQGQQVATVGGSPTGGTFNLTGYRPDTGAFVVAGPIAYNAPAAAVQAALQAAYPGYANFIAVTGSAGGPYTITGPLGLLTGDGSLLTGGTAPSATVSAGIAAPSAPTLATATTGGSIPAGTTAVVVTYTSFGGETAASAQATQATTGSTSTITVTSPATSTDATGYNVYAGPSGGPYTLQASGTIGTNTTLTAISTAGANPPAAGTATTLVQDSGMYGPFDPNATDGRQTLTRGQACILNTSLVMNGFFGVPTTATNHPSAIKGGDVWRERLIVAWTGSHSLAAGPTGAEFEAAFPRISYVDTP